MAGGNLITEEEVLEAKRRLVKAKIDPKAAGARTLDKLYPELGYQRARGVCLRLKEEKPEGDESSEEYSHERTKQTISLTKTRICTLDELIAYCKIDTSIWEVERWVCNKYEMGSVPRATGGDKEGWSLKSSEPRVTPLFQVKAWLRRKPTSLSADDFNRALKSFREWVGADKYKPVAPRKATDDYQIIVNDLHVPYHDEAILKEIIKRESGRAKGIILAGDIADMQSFSRYPQYVKTFTPRDEFMETKKVASMICEAFENVVVLPGNHDARLLKMLATRGIPADLLDYFELLSPGFKNPLSLIFAGHKNAQMVKPAELDFAKFGFFYQLGDMVICHAEKYSRTPLVAAGEVLQWLQSFAIPNGIVKPFRHVAQAHTHMAGKAAANFGCWVYELGCACKYPEYVGSAEIRTPRPWVKGYTRVYQTDGVTCPEHTNFVPLEFGVAP